MATLRSQADRITGPHDVNAATLARAKRTSDVGHDFVAVECRDAVDTGIALVETHSSHGIETSRSSTPYWAVRAENQFLLVCSEEQPSGRVEGVVREAESELMKRFDPAEQKLLLPFVLKDEDPRVWAWVFVVIVTGGTAWIVTAFTRSVLRSGDARRHPAVARLAAEGDLRATSAEIERQLGAPETRRIARRAFTRDFVVDERRARFDVRRWRDLAWAHMKVTKSKHYGITTSTSHHAVLHFTDGRALAINPRRSFSRGTGEAAVNEILLLAAQRAPWAVAGFDDALDRRWRKDRAGFLAEVAKRRGELERVDAA